MNAAEEKTCLSVFVLKVDVHSAPNKEFSCLSHSISTGIMERSGESVVKHVRLGSCVVNDALEDLSVSESSCLMKHGLLLGPTCPGVKEV